MPATGHRASRDSYWTLIEEFPLKSIRTEKDAKAARQMLDKLLARRLDAGETMYLDALTDLVERYENQHVRMVPAATKDVLDLLMTCNGLTAKELADATGIPASTISEVRSGKRSLSKANCLRLAATFHVSPAVFLEANSLAADR